MRSWTNLNSSLTADDSQKTLEAAIVRIKNAIPLVSLETLYSEEFRKFVEFPDERTCQDFVDTVKDILKDLPAAMVKRMESLSSNGDNLIQSELVSSNMIQYWI